MRSFIFILSVTLLVISVISGCDGRGENDKYFRRVTLDGRYSIRGEYPLSPEIGNKGESYHLLYNEEGRLVRVNHLEAGELEKESFFGSDVALVLIEHLETYEKRAYFDAMGLPVQNKDGVYSISILLDEDDNPVAKLNYGEYGEFAEDNYGVAQYSWTPDAEGRIKSAVFYDIQGKRIAIEEGGFETKFKYDEDGNMIERSYFDIGGNLVENEDGVAVMRRKFDDKGNIVEIRYYDSMDELTELDNDIAVIQQKFDEDGNPIEVRYLGRDEKLKENNMGVAIIRSKFDIYGNVVERKYYDISDELTEGKFYGFAIRQWEYDEKGRLKETRFLGIDGELKNILNGETAILRMKYDEDGTLEQVLHFDKEGSPVEDTLTSIP